MAKTSGMEAYSDDDLNRIAKEFEKSAMTARTMGTACPPEWDFIVKAALHIVVLRSQIQPADEKKPGLRQQALG